jgi:hypothetical protein
VVDIFFEVGSLVKLIADMDVHARPRNTGAEPVTVSGSYRAILHLKGKRQRTEIGKICLSQFVILSEAKECRGPSLAAFGCSKLGLRSG